MIHANELTSLAPLSRAGEMQDRAILFLLYTETDGIKDANKFVNSLGDNLHVKIKILKFKMMLVYYHLTWKILLLSTSKLNIVL